MAAAAGHAPTGRLAIETDVGAMTLSTNNGMLSLDFEPPAQADLVLSQDKLTQMLVGYRRPGDVLNDPDVRATGDAHAWLDVLFPTCQAYVWSADHF